MGNELLGQTIVKSIKEGVLQVGTFSMVGKSVHKLKDFPICAAKGRECTEAPKNASITGAPKKNLLYALFSRGEKEDSPDVFNGILQVFLVNVYDLLDPCATLSFVTPLVYMIICILPDVFS